MLLQSSYRIFAPVYDMFVAGATAGARKRSLSRLPQAGTVQVLISGAGTGLDFPHLHPAHRYTALDLTAAMLLRARGKGRSLQLDFVQGDSMMLPFADESFDVVVLHLILAVVPDSQRCLAEAHRVLRPGGRILLFDKFLRRGERAWLRRGLGVLTSRFVTRMDVVFEEVLADIPGLQVEQDEPALAGGWFRLIELRKQ